MKVGGIKVTRVDVGNIIKNPNQMKYLHFSKDLMAKSGSQKMMVLKFGTLSEACLRSEFFLQK